MLIFRNSGLIDLAAVTTLGVSVKAPTAFGRFGTGLKFAIATILRGGGFVNISIGLEVHVFGITSQTIRDVEFNVVTLDGKPLGFTTMLGRDWEPWMALRELACNTLDEKGSFGLIGPDNEPTITADTTTIIVEWPDLDRAFTNRGDLFAEGEPLYEDERVRVLPGPSSFVYYRGVRVLKLDKPSAFRYDLLTEQRLTEDRTLTTTYYLDREISRVMLTCDDSGVVLGMVCAGRESHENTVELDKHIDPSKTFLDAVLDARQRRDKDLSNHAVAAMHSAIRKTSTDTVSYTSSRRLEDPFSRALDIICQDLYLELPEDRMYVVVEELEGEGTLSLLQDDRVYVTRALLRSPARVIAMELVRRHLDSMWGKDDVADFLLPALFRAAGHPEPSAKSPMAEDETREIEEAGLREMVLGAPAEGVDLGRVVRVED